MLIINIANDYQSHLLTHFTTINYVNIRISKLLRKDMNTRNPIKKLQYII